MKINDWLHYATDSLQQAGIGTARLDALILVEDEIGHDRAYLLAYPETKLNRNQVTELVKKLKRRADHEPLAYIRNKTEFYGREFYINNHVLEPRPESETMIDLLKSLKDLPATIIDVGTGSGALAVTAKLEVPVSNVLALDIDPNCLEVAAKNSKKHEVNIELFQGDLLEPIKIKSPAVLLCNLPYVADDFTINPAAMREPKIAIFGGPDGLDFYRRLFKQIDDLKLDVPYILTESMPPQHQKLAEVAKKSGYKLQTTDDFIQLFCKYKV